MLGWSRRPAPGVIADRLDIRAGDTVFSLERRAMLDGLPLGMRSSWLVGAVAQPLLEPGVKIGTTELIIEVPIPSFFDPP